MATRADRDFESWRARFEKNHPHAYCELTLQQVRALFDDANAAGYQHAENDVANDMRRREASR